MRTKAILNAGKRCQCPACGEFFSTESNFNRHRSGEYGKDRHCVNPESVGLVIGANGASTYWQMPGNEAV